MTDLRRVREATLARFGRLDGIVHAAGIPGGGLVEVRDHAEARAVMAPKILGSLALREVFGDLDLDFVAYCSSVTALTGGVGQADYCAANCFLDAHARSAHGWRARVLSIDWGGWLDVGMAAEAAAGGRAGLEAAAAIDHPLLTARHAAEAEGLPWCGGVLSPRRQWVLDEHRIGGVPVLPGTAYLEVMRCAVEAVTTATPGTALELRDVSFVAPLAVGDEQHVELRVRLNPGEGGIEVRVESAGAGEVRTHAQGTAARVEGKAPPTDLDAIRARCTEVPPPAAAGSAVRFGPRWDSLQRVFVGAGEELALIEAPGPVVAELARWVLHPALLDVATSFGRRRGDGQFLPFGYGRLAVHGRLPGRFWSHLRHREVGSSDVVVADVTLVDDAGRPLVEVSDFVLRRTDVRTMTAAAAGAASAPATAVTGIRPADGAQAFHRLLTVDLGPQVVVQPVPLERSLSVARRLAPAQPEPPPAGGGDVDAPAGELETLVASVWSGLLGVERVGPDDDFFELGGNSLVAVQLMSAIRRATGVRLPMRSLFDSPTVGGMAALVRERRETG